MPNKLKPLYKRSTTGKISYWEVEVEGNKFRTISGYNDGKKVYGEWTICDGKSYNTSEEQALKQATALHKKKKDLGAFENIEDVDQPTIFKPMLANKFEDYRDKVKYPLYSQPKLDGVRCIIKSDGMWSRTGKKIVSAQHIFDSVKIIFESFPDLVLDGELYCDKLANDFNKIISCVRKTKPTQEDLEESERFIEYWVYDYVDTTDFPFSQRYEYLMDNYGLGDLKYVRFVPTYKLNNEESVVKQLAAFLKSGFEGQMLRVGDSFYENKRSKSLLKHKEFETEEFTIVAFNEGIGKLQNKVGTITIVTKEDVLVNCAVNGTHEFLEHLLKMGPGLIGAEATVRYFNKTEDGSLRFPKVIDIDRWKFE
jgi:DNA ligase-1